MTRLVTIILAIIAIVIVGAFWIANQPIAQAQYNGSSSQYVYINSATTTTIKTYQGTLNNITINGGTAGVITLFDIEGSGCTGTPASGKFATIETIGATNPVTLQYNLTTRKGLCVVTASAIDVTISFN